MKIAFVVGTFPTLSVSFILNQIKGLLDNGYEVDIYALDGAPDNLDKLHPIVQEYRLLERTYYPPKRPKNFWLRWLKTIGLLVTNLTKNPWQLLPLLHSQRFGKEAREQKLFYKAFPFLNQKKYDLIHCQFGIFGLMCLAFRELGLIEGKLITNFRGYDISKYVQKRGNKVYNQLFREGDFFITNCEYFRQKAINLGCQAQQIVVIGSGIDCTKFTFKPRYFPSDGLVKIVTTGRLVEKKGIEYGIKAIAELIKTHPQVEYNIIGDGELRPNLEQLINQLNLNDKVKLLGWKQQEELIETLDKSHILIAPCVTAADGNQDAPVNTLKEAMAMGLPVIGTSHGGIPELIEDGVSGWLVPERDSSAIAEKLRHLIDNPETWATMGQAGRKQVETKYNMEQLNDQLVTIYRQILNQELDKEKLTTQVLAFIN